MKKNLTELVFVIDQSGSMWDMRADTVGGINSVLKEQQGKEGEVLVSTVLFNQSSSVIHDRVPIDEVRYMTEDDYCPSGCTALIDALGGAIHHIAMIHKYARPEDVPEKTLFIITTDGLENASHHYTASEVREMVKHEQEKYGWEFVYLAANIDAASTAETYGIDRSRAVDYHNDRRGNQMKFCAASNAIRMTREHRSLDNPFEWRAEADRDFKDR